MNIVQTTETQKREEELQRAHEVALMAILIPNYHDWHRVEMELDQLGIRVGGSDH